MISARKRIWGWYFFDWASQPYNTLLLTFIFGPYFAEVARAHFAAGGADTEAAKALSQAYWTSGLTITGILIAILSPVLGAISDGAGRRMLWIWLFSGLYVLGSFMLWWTLPVMPTLFWPVFWFAIGFVGMELATTFTNALMPDLTGAEEMGKISGSGFAFGYAGGVLALVVMLLFLAESGDTGKTLTGLSPAFGLDPAMREGTRAVGPFTAIWFAVFMVPFFLWVREPKRSGRRLSVGQSLGQLVQAVSDLVHRRSLATYLVSSMFYRDSLNAVYGLGGAYASNVMGWSVTQSGIFGILAAITAAGFSWAGGRMDARFGPKVVISWSILALTAVVAVMVGLTPESVFGIAMAEGSALPDAVFYLCGAVIGAAGGTVQAASRTLMVYHVTAETAASGFGLYGLSGKATAFLAPAMVTAATYASGSARIGISPLIALFLVGLILLLWVNPKGEKP
ncbi:MAG: MFS transporter [Rhodobacter sp.]|nr:MFS transporter [Rhodobacter sp.]